LAVQYGCRRVVLLSTDKAVNPTSIMGASKRICELVGSALSTAETEMVSVRMGNVVGTRGSIFTIFEDQLRQRQALTVTHLDATRYLLTMNEAVDLLLNATWLGNAGEILVPKLSKAAKIIEIAERFIQNAGLVPEKDIPIEIIGLRSGEKLHEELTSEIEQVSESELPGICRVAPPEISPNKLEHWFGELSGVLAKADRTDLIFLIKQILPEYRPGILLPSERFRETA
jgi:FlaA1/EpsC-like NDP-sugar epimerase